MNERVGEKLAIKAEGKSWYMLAEDVIPADLKVPQMLVDALAVHDVITRYDVNV